MQNGDTIKVKTSKVHTRGYKVKDVIEEVELISYNDKYMTVKTKQGDIWRCEKARIIE